MPAAAVLPVAFAAAGFVPRIELTFGVAMTDDPSHVPVLLAEALDALAIRAEGTYVDATFGAGGHSRAIAARLDARGRLLALDRDPAASALAAGVPGCEFVHANFADLESVLDERHVATLDGILFDFGVSSMQLDQPERGFSFRDDGPLDMRMDPTTGPTAWELLEGLDERELADLIFQFGEDRASRRIARAIVRAREAGRLPERAAGLAALIAGVVHVRGSRERTHPATRTFQALRIAVNGELDAIACGLQAAAARLRPGGRVVAISFHSLEDRIVKHAFRDDPRLHAVVKRPLVPSEDERSRNFRARSAKLRVAERLA